MPTKNKVGLLPKEEQTILRQLLKKNREGGKADSRFDIALAEGEIAEEEIRQLFTGGVTIEVKRDFRVSDTGNVAIEEASRGKPSGITVTQAKVWAIVLDGPEYGGQVRILIDTDRLKCIVEMQKRYLLGGDSGFKAKIRAIPIEWLLKKNSDLVCPNIQADKVVKKKRVTNSRNKKTGK
jgi:hypothetical protein